MEKIINLILIISKLTEQQLREKQKNCYAKIHGPKPNFYPHFHDAGHKLHIWFDHIR